MGNDNIEFFTENHEFKIVLTKRQKVYSSAIFAKYICNIKFINSIGFEVLNIQCSEKEILNLIQTLYEFNINIGGILSDGVNFDSSNICYYLYLSIIDNNSYEYDYFSKKRERFNKRFKDVNKEILKKYLRKHKRKPQTFPEYATYFLSFGAIHISKEFLYQLSKLKKKDDDTPKKYVIRNRYNFTAFALAIILANGMIGNRNTISAQESTYETSTQSTKSDTEQEKTDNETKNMNKRKNEVQTKILLTRKYVIKPGDYLSKIAEDAGISIYELQTINNIRSADLIKIGDTLIVPYNIESENKEFYTKKIVLFDRDLSKIAAEYETDFDTLYRLNEEAIEKVTDNTYVVLSDTIEVPNFITTTELNSMKEKTKNY